jgi:hypothetical protein
LALGPECSTEIGGLRSELYDPPGTNLAGVQEVVFNQTERRDATVIISLDRVVVFDVSQGRMRNVIRVETDPNAVAVNPFDAVPHTRAGEASRAVAAPSTPAGETADDVVIERPPGAVVQNESRPTAAAPDRRPIRLVQRSAERGERFVIQLAVGPNVGEPARDANSGSRAGSVLYINDNSIGGRRWQELRLGFFDTEQQARDSLVALQPAFPQAVISIAGVEEQDRAAAEALQPAAGQDMPLAADSDVASERDLPALSADRIDALLVEGNEAMLSEDYDRGIQIYSRLLEETGLAERRDVRERLGIARERNGQLAQARREYDAYLLEFPTGPDAQRVRQRLAGLIAAANPAREPLASPRGTASAWDFWGGVSQYVRRDVLRPLDDQPERTVQSALFSNVDFSLRRRGERFELLSRVNAAYHYNLLEEAETSDPADQLYVSNAYLDLIDGKHDWAARLGRQSLHGSGVLGRFDGAHVNYQWRPDIALNLTLGRPVDFPRHAIDTHRQFVGFSADLDELVRRWDFTFFTIAQEIDGIADRQAAGAEARFRGDDWNVVAAIDVDPSYGVLNSALTSANWRATDKLTLSGRVNVGAAPFLTTRNALIGQSVATMAELLETYSEPQIRRLARDRTAQARDAAVGLSWPVFDRFQLNVDLGFLEIEATLESGGVAGIPDGGRQTFFHAGLVGSSILKRGDTTILSLRRSDSRSATTDTLVFDLRLPATERLRLNPRLALSSRTHTGDASEQWIAAPMLRIAYRSPRHHRFEVELGGEWSNREFEPGAEALAAPEDSSAYFINAGYWWEF